MGNSIVLGSRVGKGPGCAVIMFHAFDFGIETDPTVYLRNIGSTAAPVPEPATIILLCTGMIGLVGLRRKSRKE